MNAFQISAFADELEKSAAMPQLLHNLWRSGAARAAIKGAAGSGAARAAIGGAMGAGTGALADPENRLRGAILGGALGAGGGYAAPLLTRAGRQKAVQSLKHLGKKTKYEVTGRGNVPIPAGISEKAKQEILDLDRAGLLSVPGIAKGLAKNPLQTIKGAWKNSGRMGKAMAVGEVGLSAPNIMNRNTQEGFGEKALGTLGSTGGYLLGGRMGVLGSMAMGSGLGALGGAAGKVFGGGKKAVPVPNQGMAAHAMDVVGRAVPDRPSSVFARQMLSQAVPNVGQLVRPGRG